MRSKVFQDLEVGKSMEIIIHIINTLTHTVDPKDIWILMDDDNPPGKEQMESSLKPLHKDDDNNIVEIDI